MPSLEVGNEMADNKIKGITIEFDGDTSKLGKALKDIRKEANAVDKELKDVDKLLKFNPKNTELLAQKQTLLKQKVKDTEQSLTNLKNVQKQMDAKNVDKNSEAYRRVRREIIEANSKLKHYKSELLKLGNVKLTALGKQFEDVGKKMKGTGDAMSKYITGPIAALTGAGAAGWSGMQGSLNIITKLTGATGDALTDMQAIMESMAKTVPADMDTIANSIGEVNTRFGITGDELEKVSSLFVKFASVNGTDVIQSIDGIQKAMSAFGVSVEDTDKVLDLLTKVSQDTGVSVDKLYQGLVSNSTAFQEMGLSINDAAYLMGQLEKSGVNSETVLNGMRKALKAAAKDGVPLEEELAKVQDEILNSTDSAKGLQAAYEVFGKSGDQMYGAIKSGAINFHDLAKASSDASGSLEKTFDATITPAEQFKTILNELKILGYNIGNTVLPYVNKAISKIIKGIEKLTAWWNKLGPGMQKTLLVLVGILASIGPVLSIAGRALQLFGNILQNVSKAVGLLSKAFAFLASNPIVAVIAVIGLLVARFIYLWKTSEQFRQYWINLWTNFKNMVSESVGRVVQEFKGMWTKIKNVFAGWNAFWNGLWAGVRAKLGSIGTSIGQAVSGAIKGGVNGVITRVENIINTAIALINGAITLANKLPGVNVGKVKSLHLPRLAKGGILTGAQTVIAGEAGPEAIIPLDELWRHIDAINGGTVINVYGAEGQSVNELAAAVERRLIAAQKRRSMAWA